ncbi:G/U mismatch-specific uracil-DNA glycosylase [Mucilaginibacter gracilis]|uniref:G/U mismatch-specific uracil-DNA glycosylase n=1 Tax=Mucilaginibacter gracilis TaxID=423350 RepID=A0A495JBE1_9SPHI|nr:DNA-deoxyinosine glycosylase [Mucilaginibacter gracilis]RKR85379.1 G/U mismatch-specific uracil-DNA glycosylase [Mucilaginibacter gracilis]
MNLIKTAFKPVIDANSQILILGSMPGERSLTEQQYYANKQNAFWKIMSDVYNSGEALTNYHEKTSLLQANKIALWDVFESCERQGSLDANIKNGVVNNFEALFKTHPQIQLVLFNGNASFKAFKKQVQLLNAISYQIMPSTSAAHTMAYQTKLNTWQVALANGYV